MVLNGVCVCLKVIDNFMEQQDIRSIAAFSFRVYLFLLYFFCFFLFSSELSDVYTVILVFSTNYESIVLYRSRRCSNTMMMGIKFVFGSVRSITT